MRSNKGIKSKIIISLVCILALILPACGSSGGSSGGEKKIINIGMMNAPSGFNPLEWTDVAQEVSCGLLFQALVELDDDMKYKPMLADSITTDDNKTFTIKLNSKAKWSDGKPVTVDDEIYTIGLISNPKVPSTVASNFNIVEGLDEKGKNSAGTTGISGVKKVDDHTMTITTKEPMELTLFEDTLGTKLKALPKHILQSTAPEKIYQSSFIQKPTVSDGPFKLEKYVKDQYVQFTANKDYFKGTPKLDGLIFKIMPGANITAQLQSGEIDMNDPQLGQIPFEDYSKVKGMSNLTTDSKGVQSTIQTLMINTQTITDPKVRKAISYAIDRNMIINSLLKGEGQIIEQPYLKESKFLNKDLKPTEHDPEKAKALLKEAGWDPNKAINFDIPTGNKVREQVADIITQNLKSVGLKVNPQKYDFVTSLATAKKHNFDIYLVGIPVYPMNPDVSSILKTGQGLNLSQYSNPEMDSLLASGLHQTDPAQVKATYDKVQEIFAQDLPCPSVYVQNQLRAVNKRVTYGKPKNYGMFIDVYKWDVQSK
ncbi:ABC transporter substrate-binding protein [Clostridium luticellarii]|uniref:Oligopeptide-binding protein AppA n=1 Tax=Clostridium luticellarii TaxID=1691940 RepID=A0A2T0BNK1_9CLOT|nr:peptide ABC transporter substrate-binding protein [Clostridium luticellarii]PRR85459.1 Oligopeptide-binding protein AppA precursor [Clostridium luticellarii]